MTLASRTRSGLLASLVPLILAGCNGGTSRTVTPAPISGCEVPSSCDAYSEAHPEALKAKLLHLFDQIEMSSAPENRKRVLPVLQELELMLNNCPARVQPELIAQLRRPVHETQRAALAQVLGWYPAGRSCSLPVLTDLTRDPVPAVRFEAAAALCDLDDPGGVDVLLDEASVHPTPHVRERALAVLSEYAGRTFRTREEAAAVLKARP